MGFKISNFNFWGIFRKTNIFWDMKNLLIVLGHYKTGLFGGVVSIHFTSCFLRPMNRMGIFLGSLKFKYVLGVPYFLIF